MCYDDQLCNQLNNYKLMNRIRRKQYIKYFSIILLLAILLYFFSELGIERIRSKIDTFGIWAPFTIFALRSISIIIPALPSTAYSLLSGSLLGFKTGLIVIFLSDIFACTSSYLIARIYGRGFVNRLVGKKFISRVEKLSQNHLERNFFLLLGLLMTGLFDFVCYGAGLAKSPLNKFVPAMLLSIILSDTPIVALGAGILEGGKTILVFSVFAIFVLALITKRVKQIANL